MDISKVYPSKYLKATDLMNKRVSLIISDVCMEQIMGSDDDVPVVYFSDKTKGLVLNRTNSGMITEILGTSETDDWLNHEIILYSTKVDYMGKRVDGIRVEDPNTEGARVLGVSPSKTKQKKPPVDAGDDGVPF